MAGIADVEHVERILEAHQAKADRAMAQVGVFGFGCGVIVDVDHVVEHAHRCRIVDASFFSSSPFLASCAQPS